MAALDGHLETVELLMDAELGGFVGRPPKKTLCGWIY